MAMRAPSLTELIDDLVADAELFGPDGPCPVRREPGRRRDLLLVTGDNASGKSFVCKYLNMQATPDSADPPAERRGLEFMHVGMNLRAGGSGVQRSLMFGNEARNSTGAISARTIETGFRTSRGRTTPHVLCLDEPDIGLSEEYQDACGRLIAEFAAAPPAHLSGLVVVTHSRPIARVLDGLDPVRLRVGADARSTQEWLDRPRTVSLETLRDLGDAAHRRYRAIETLMDARRKDTA